MSDTLLFRSPTCTAVDERAARELAEIAGLDIEKYAIQMFSAGSNLKDKSDKEIFYQDFKRFTSGKLGIGVGQITSLDEHDLNMTFFMLTNILTQSTELLCHGQGAVQLAAKAFHKEIEEEGQPVVELPGVVSRKKQLIPELMLAEQS